MQAVMAIRPGVLGLGELEVPTPGEYEALVRMEACAICNSTDHKLLTNEFCPGTFPVVLGHEVISRVVSIGAKVKNFAPGDRVFRQRLENRHVPAGGRSCWGGFAEFGLVLDKWAREGVPYGPEPLPHDQQKLLIDVEPALAAGMVTLMETLDCIRACGAAPGKAVAIVGSGPVGQAFALLARLLGATPVFVFGRRAEPAQRFASICQADGYVVGQEFPAEVKRLIQRGGFDIVMEAVGSAAALDLCITLAGTSGQVRVYGIAPKSVPYRPDQTVRKNVATVGAVEGRAQAQLAEFIQAGKIRLEDWVSHRLPLSDFQPAFDLVAGRQALKAVLLAEG